MWQGRIWGKAFNMHFGLKLIALSQTACFPCTVLHFHSLDKTCNIFIYNIIFTSFIIATIWLMSSSSAPKLCPTPRKVWSKRSKAEANEQKMQDVDVTAVLFIRMWKWKESESAIHQNVKVKVKVKSTRNATHWLFLRLYFSEIHRKYWSNNVWSSISAVWSGTLFEHMYIYIIYAGSVLFNIQLLSTSVIHKTLETLIIKSFVLPPHPVHRLQSRDTSC